MQSLTYRRVPQHVKLADLAYMRGTRYNFSKKYSEEDKKPSLFGEEKIHVGQNKLSLFEADTNSNLSSSLFFFFFFFFLR